MNLSKIVSNFVHSIFGGGGNDAGGAPIPVVPPPASPAVPDAHKTVEVPAADNFAMQILSGGFTAAGAFATGATGNSTQKEITNVSFMSFSKQFWTDPSTGKVSTYWGGTEFGHLTEKSAITSSQSADGGQLSFSQVTHQDGYIDMNKYVSDNPVQMYSNHTLEESSSTSFDGQGGLLLTGGMYNVSDQYLNYDPFAYFSGGKG